VAISCFFPGTLIEVARISRIVACPFPFKKLAMQNEESLFAAAIAHDSPEERAAFVESACAGNPSLRARIEGLLRAHEHPDSFLNTALEATDGSAARGNFETSALVDKASAADGKRIGHYHLLQIIGEGGMGTVYMAEQTDPVKRKVALKVIKAGLDSRQVIVRFEAERQTLALMDHPHIAKVLDAGATATGAPYFVMELVNGDPITRFCDDRRLSPRERLKLFLPVCQAVQHAHTKGIIHRDLKPSNVLVALYDGRPVPKVIDFGVAKATEMKLTERTMFTEFGAILGTLEYMSPEQAERNQLDIDTRSDIYSLGVLLYELLTGSPPLDRQRLKDAALLDLLEAIRMEEPPRPSTRLSTSEALPSIAANRSLEPKKLSGVLRGELDWIVMKALEKDRNRRYDTAIALAQDVERYLADEPVLACPPSAGYRFQKFFRKHRASCLATCGAALALIAGLVGLEVSRELLSRERDAKSQALVAQDVALTAAQNAEAEETRQRTLAERKQQEAEQQTARADQNFQMAREAVDRLLTQAAEALRDKPQMDSIRRTLLNDALSFYQRFLDVQADDPGIRYESALAAGRVGQIQNLLGQYKEAAHSYRGAAPVLQLLVNEQPNATEAREELARCHHGLAAALISLHEYDEGVEEFEKSTAMWTDLARDWPDRPHYLYSVAESHAGLAGHWRSRYRFARSGQHTKRIAELLEEIGRRFPDFPIAEYLKAEARADGLANISPDQTDEKGAPIRRNYNMLPHDPETLQLYEAELTRSMAYWEGQIAAHPDIPRHQGEFLVAASNLSKVLYAENRTEDLRQLLLRCEGKAWEMADRFPEDLLYKVGAAWDDWMHGMFHWQAGDKLRSREFLRRALATIKTATELKPEELRYHVHFVGMLNNCPDVTLMEPELAIAEAQRTMELGGDESDRASLALAQTRAGRHDEALATMEICRKAVPSAHPFFDMPEAVIRLNLGQNDQALLLYRRAMKSVEQGPNRYWYTAEYRLFRKEFDRRLGLSSEVDAAPPRPPK
jgi:serine/threonine protein kinase